MSETQLVRCLERAAAHQYKALTYLRDARSPHAARALSQARDRLIWALEHVMHARSLLRQYGHVSDSNFHRSAQRPQIK